jgi:hypothetical protein
VSSNERVIAVGLLTRADIALLGTSYDRLWPVDETPCFGGLLAAIDEADRAMWRMRDQDQASRGSRSDPSETDTVLQFRPAIPFAPPE